MKYKNILIGILLVFLFMLFVYLLHNKNTKITTSVLTMYYFVGLFSTSKKQAFTIISPILIIFIISFFQKGTLLAVTYFYLFFIPLVTFTGYYLKDKVIAVKFIPILFMIPLGLYFYPNWFIFYRDINSRKFESAPTIILKDDTGNSIRLDTIKNKIIVLDFWSTSCGSCIKSFPEFEKISNEYKNNATVDFYIVNIPNKRDTLGEAKQIVLNRNVKANSLYAENTSILDSLNFDGFPHLIILKNAKIRYSGGLNINKGIKPFYLKNEVNKLLEEHK